MDSRVFGFQPVRRRVMGSLVGALLIGGGFTLGLVGSASAQDLSDPGAFGEDFLGCVSGASISGCTDEVFQNLGLREDTGTLVDNTPFNPVDEGSIEFVDDVSFPSEADTSS
jgi:hypothetical protein